MGWQTEEGPVHVSFLKVQMSTDASKLVNFKIRCFMLSVD